MVLVHHAASIAGGRAGWVATPAAVYDGGVAVFFVLSGFLLYRPMVVADASDRPSLPWRVFWWRRVLRIVPAYWVALTVLWAAGAFELGGQWWRFYLFLQIYDELTVLGGIAEFEREIMLERQREGIAKAKAEGKYKGRKPTAMAKAEEVKKLHGEGVGATEIAQRLGIGRASVYRVLGG